MKKDDFKYKVLWEPFRCELIDDYGMYIPLASIYNELSKMQFIESGDYDISESEVVYDIYSLLDRYDEELIENRVFPYGTLNSYTLRSKKTISYEDIQNIHTIALNLGYKVNDVETNSHSYTFKLEKNEKN